MASPQTENGYTVIANELLEALYKTKLSGMRMSIIFCVIRSTYGFNRKSHSMSSSFIAKAIEGNLRRVQQEISALIDMEVIKVYKEASFSSSRQIGINKNYEQWKTEKTEPTTLHTASEIAHDTASEIAHQKNHSLKQIENKSKKAILPEISEEAERLYKLYPRKKGKADAMKRLPKLISDHGTEKIEKAILRYAAEVKGKDEQYIKHASTFFSKGYMDYIDDGADPDPGNKKRVEIEEVVTVVQYD